MRRRAALVVQTNPRAERVMVDQAEVQRVLTDKRVMVDQMVQMEIRV